MSERADEDAPRYRLHVEYTFDDYNEAIRSDAMVVAGGMRSRGLLAWAVLFALVIFPQLWLRPVRGAAGPAAPPVGQALINLVTASLPLLSWLLVFAFILTNVYLTLRGRKRRERPAYQVVKPGAGASYGGRLGWIILVALVLVAQTVVGAVTNTGDAERRWRGVAREAVVRLLPTLAFLGAGGVVLYFGARARIRRGWHGQPSLHLRHTFDFFDDCVIVDTTQTRTESSWTAYPRILETPNLLLLYVSDLAFHILPKRTISSAGEPSAIRVFLIERITKPTQAFPVVPSPTPAR